MSMIMAVNISISKVHVRFPWERGGDFARFFTHIQNTEYIDTFTVETTAFSNEGTVDNGMLNEQFGWIRKPLM